MCGCLCVYKDAYSKELAYTVVGADKSEVRRADGRAGNSQAGAEVLANK